MADTKIVTIVLCGLLMWAVLLVASYSETEVEAGTLQTAASMPVVSSNIGTQGAN